MNKCAGCTLTAAVDARNNIWCDDGETTDEAVGFCPCCGSPMINNSQHRIACGSYTTTYECGSQFVVNHYHRRFVAINRISDLCHTLKMNTIEDDTI